MFSKRKNLIFFMITVLLSVSAAIAIGNTDFSNDKAYNKPVEITAVLDEIHGMVTIENEALDNSIVSERAIIEVGSTIRTSNNASAEISFEDGSSFKIDENTTIIIKRMKGIIVNPENAEAFHSVYSVVIELPTGKIYGNLAPAFYIIPKDANTPTRVKVDMPWGIAGIRGTIWSNEVTSSIQITNVLRGKVEVSTQSKSIYVTKGEKVELTSDYISVDMLKEFTEVEREDWEKVDKWVEKRENIINKKKELRYEVEEKSQVYLYDNKENQNLELIKTIPEDKKSNSVKDIKFPNKSEIVKKTKNTENLEKNGKSETIDKAKNTKKSKDTVKLKSGEKVKDKKEELEYTVKLKKDKDPIKSEKSNKTKISKESKNTENSKDTIKPKKDKKDKEDKDSIKSEKSNKTKISKEAKNTEKSEDTIKPKKDKKDKEDKDSIKPEKSNKTKISKEAKNTEKSEDTIKPKKDKKDKDSIKPEKSNKTKISKEAKNTEKSEDTIKPKKDKKDKDSIKPEKSNKAKISKEAKNTEKSEDTIKPKKDKKDKDSIEPEKSNKTKTNKKNKDTDKGENADKSKKNKKKSGS